MKSIHFRLTDADLKVIQDGAKSVNKTLSDYARDNLLSRAKSEAENRDKEANIFIKEVQEIKTNIKILSSKLSEIDGKIVEENKQVSERVVSLEKKVTGIEEDNSNLLNVAKEVVTIFYNFINRKEAIEDETIKL